MHVIMKRNRITVVTGSIDHGGETLKCKFFPTTGKLMIEGPNGFRSATHGEGSTFLYELFGKKSELLDKLDHERATRAVRVGTRTSVSRFERACVLAEEALA
ncbi:MAG: hypothetical protein ABID61_00545 [Candidatus Micrarchaeota archaeon]